MSNKLLPTGWEEDVGGGPEHPEPASLEQLGWEALSSTPEAAARFYGEVLDHSVVMLLPGGIVLDDRSTIIESMSGQPWSTHQLHDLRTLPLTPDTAVVTYGVTAQRAGTPAYSALVSSVYVRRGDAWRMAFHQQTSRPAAPNG